MSDFTERMKEAELNALRERVIELEYARRGEPYRRPQKPKPPPSQLSLFRKKHPLMAKAIAHPLTKGVSLLLCPASVFIIIFGIGTGGIPALALIAMIMGIPCLFGMLAMTGQALDLDERLDCSPAVI